ncbi:MAG: DinB family protein [Ignavibacteriales bacterium]|nr:DinB family protein [Ignavibacteriales bacterium]
MKKSTMFSVLLALLAFMLTLGTAQEKGREMTGPKSGFQAEFVKNISDVEKKLVSLAEATPPGIFKWRPSEGVRSVSEVYMHVVEANYFIPSFAGVKPPAMDRNAIKAITDKAKVVEMLKASFENVRQAISKLSDADLEKKTKMFGQDATYREVYLVVLSHGHEHMGQSIAYARTNGIVPPWSAKGE